MIQSFGMQDSLLHLKILLIITLEKDSSGNVRQASYRGDVTDTLYLLRGKISANMAELFSDYTCEIWWDIHSWTDVSTRSIAPQKLSYVCPLKETPRNITMTIFGELVEHNEVKARCTSLGGVPLSVYIYGE